MVLQCIDFDGIKSYPDTIRSYNLSSSWCRYFQRLRNRVPTIYLSVNGTPTTVGLRIRLKRYLTPWNAIFFFLHSLERAIGKARRTDKVRTDAVRLLYARYHFTQAARFSRPWSGTEYIIKPLEYLTLTRYTYIKCIL